MITKLTLSFFKILNNKFMRKCCFLQLHFSILSYKIIKWINVIISVQKYYLSQMFMK